MSARWALAVFLVLQGLFALTASGYVFRIPDELEVYFQTESLRERGSLAVPQALEVRHPDGTSAFFGKLSGKTPYAPYGPGAAFLALGHHEAGRLLSADLRGGAATLVRSGVTSLATSTAAALACVAFFAAARALGASARRAGGLAVLLGVGTVAWPYATCFYSEALAMAALTGAAALLLRARERWPLLVPAALLLAVATLVKATNVVYALGLAAAPLLDRDVPREGRWRATGVLLLGVAAACLVHAQWNVARFGSPFDLGYDWRETLPSGKAFAAANLPRGLVVLLLSPGKSLLLWAPAVPLLALPRAKHDPALGKTLGLLLGLGLALFGSYAFVEGGYCHGPRHLVPIVPLLLLPAALGPPPGRRAVLAALALGVPLNALAVATSPLEDQAWGIDRTRSVYYERVDDPPPGVATNRYRLAYAPQVTLPRLLAAPSGEVGRGPDFFALHLATVARLDPGQADALRRTGALHVAGSAAVLLLGIALFFRTLLRPENAAILPAREAP